MTTNNAPAAGEAADTQNVMTSSQVLGTEEGDPLDAIVREVERLKFERDDFEHQLKDKSAELDTLSGISGKAADSLKQKDDQIADLQKQLDELNAQLAAKAVEADAEPVAEVPAETLHVEAPAAETLVAPQVDFDAELKAKDETIAGLSEQLAQAKRELDAKLQTHAAAQEELDAANAAKQALQKEVDELHMQLNQINKGVQAELRQDESGGIPVLGTVAAASAVTSGIQKRSTEEELEAANKRIAELELELGGLKATAPAASLNVDAPLTPEVAVAPDGEAVATLVAPTPADVSVEAPSADLNVEAPAITPVDESQATATLVAPTALTAGIVSAGVASDGADRTAELEAQLSAKSAELADLQARIDALKNVLNARGLDLDSAEQQRLSLVQSHTTVLGDVQTQLTALSSDNDALHVSKAEVEAQLQAAHADMDALKLAGEEHERTLAGKVSEIGVLTAGAAVSIATIKQKDAALADLQAQLDALNTEKAGIEAALGESNTRLADLQTQFDALVEANSRMATLQTQIDELTAAKTAAETALAGANEQLGHAQEQLVALQASKAELETAHADAQTRLTELSGNFDSLSLEKNSLVGNLDTHKLELEGVNAKVADLTAQLEAATAAKADLEAQLADLTNAKSALEVSVQEKEAALADAQSRLTELSGNLDSLSLEKNSLVGNLDTHKLELEGVNAKVSDLTAQLEAANNSRAGVEAQLADLNTKLAAEQDDKERSVGAQVAKVAALTAALAAANAASGRRDEEAQAAQKQLADVQAQVGTLTAERDALNARLAELDVQVKDFDAQKATLVANVDAHGANVEALNARLAGLQDELNAASAARDAAQARVAELEAGVSTSTASLETLQAQLKDAQDQAMALAAERDTAQAQVKSLEEELATARTNGSGPAPAGVASLAALGTVAAVTTAHSKDAAVEAAAAAGVETKTSACPQDLAEVTAIGSVFEQRLYAAGVGTYWELAQLTDDQFTTILQLNDRQLARMDFSAVRNDALRLAGETGSLGRIWGGTAPDDFEPLEGIGGTYEKRLYDAGICTYEALANTPVEELMRLCPPTKLRKPDYELWIRQARALISQPKG